MADWLPAAFNVSAPIVALVVGGLLGRVKTKADAHAVVVADAITVAQKANERADQVNTRLDGALRRIDELEEAERRRDDLARTHLRWDWTQLRKLTDLGEEVPEPPPLFWYDAGK